MTLEVNIEGLINIMGTLGDTSFFEAADKREKTTNIGGKDIFFASPREFGISGFLIANKIYST